MGLLAAVAAAPTDRSHLHVMFARADKVVGRVATPSGRVRWGPSVGVEFAYPVPDVIRHETLFVPSRGGGALCLRDGMVGEVRVGEGRIPLADLAAWGLVRGRGRRRRMELTREMTGRVTYRGLVFEFGFGPAPRPEVSPRRDRVPLRFRKKFLSRDEWPFVAFSWALYGVLLYGALLLASLPLPEAPHPEAVAQRFAKLIYEAPQAATPARTEILERREEMASEAAPEAEAPGETAPEAPVETAPETVVESKPDVEPTPKLEASPAAVAPAAPATGAPPGAEGPKGPTREQIRQKVARRGLLGVLGGRGGASTARTRASVLEGGGAAGDLDRVLENVKGLRAAPVGGGGGGGGPLVATGVDEAAGRLAGTRGAGVTLARRAEEAIEAPREVVDDGPTLEDVVSAIRKAVGPYLGGIRYLYNRELRRNPDLEGKLTVRITIAPDGSVLEATVVSSTLDAPRLEKAVIARIRKWRFPSVAVKPVTVTYPFVFFPTM